MVNNIIAKSGKIIHDERDILYDCYERWKGRTKSADKKLIITKKDRIETKSNKPLLWCIGIYCVWSNWFKENKRHPFHILDRVNER